jgi:hypothetical protein
MVDNYGGAPPMPYGFQQSGYGGSYGGSYSHAPAQQQQDWWGGGN